MTNAGMIHDVSSCGFTFISDVELRPAQSANFLLFFKKGVGSSKWVVQRVKPKVCTDGVCLEGMWRSPLPGFIAFLSVCFSVGLEENDPASPSLCMELSLFGFSLSEWKSEHKCDCVCVCVSS